MRRNIVLGDSRIDRQHEEILSRFEHLDAAETASERRSDALSDLTVLLCSHFRTEEKLMARLALPENMHREFCKEHLRIIEEISNAHLDLMHWRENSPKQVLSKLANWVDQHLIEFDLTLKPYLEPQTQRIVL